MTADCDLMTGAVKPPAQVVHFDFRFPRRVVFLHSKDMGEAPWCSIISMSRGALATLTVTALRRSLLDLPTLLVCGYRISEAKYGGLKEGCAIRLGRRWAPAETLRSLCQSLALGASASRVAWHNEMMSGGD